MNTTVLKRAIRYARDESEADTLVAEAKEDYDRVSAECAKSLERIKAELDGLKHLRRSLSDIRDSKTLSKKSDEIMADGNLVKDYIHEYVTDIVLYKPDESWGLVIVRFVDGSERWGTVKNERYRKSELRTDNLFDKVKYTGWLVNNDNHRFHYDKDTRLFSELKYARQSESILLPHLTNLSKIKGCSGSSRRMTSSWANKSPLAGSHPPICFRNPSLAFLTDRRTYGSDSVRRTLYALMRAQKAKADCSYALKNVPSR